MPKQDFFATFDHLKRILESFQDRLVLQEDTPQVYSLDTPYVEEWKRELFFGSAEIKKNYVSFHLMPVYMYPDLLEDVSEPLKKRMQGKSCFNFKRVHSELFAELEELVHRGFARLEDEKIV